jgi:outer membrane protein
MNVVLTIAVAVLFYLHFSKPIATTNTGNTNEIDTSAISNIKLTKEQKDTRIVYLNIDTLLENYTHYQEVSKKATDMVKGYQSSLQQKAVNFQKDYEDYVNKAGQGLIPKDDAIKIEKKLQVTKDELDQSELGMERIQLKAEEMLDVVRKTLYDFFKMFCKKNNYSCILTYTIRGEGALGVDENLDVTDQVVKSINQEYEEKLKNNPEKK